MSYRVKIFQGVEPAEVEAEYQAWCAAAPDKPHEIGSSSRYDHHHECPWNAALDALVAFHEAKALASMPCQEVNCYVESDPVRYAANPHRICDVHEARAELARLVEEALA